MRHDAEIELGNMGLTHGEHGGGFYTHTGGHSILTPEHISPATDLSCSAPKSNPRFTGTWNAGAGAATDIMTQIQTLNTQ